MVGGTFDGDGCGISSCLTTRADGTTATIPMSKLAMGATPELLPAAQALFFPRPKMGQPGELVFESASSLAALHAALTPPGQLPRVVRLYQKLKAVARLWPGLSPVPGIVHGTHAYAHLRARNYDPWIMPGSK